MNVCNDKDFILVLLKEEGVFQEEGMHEEIKKLEEGQYIWSRESWGRRIRNEIREVEGSQIILCHSPPAPAACRNSWVRD